MKMVLIAALGVGLSAPAADVAFRVGSVEMVAPVPKGYCPAEGNVAATAQRIAAADSRNVTHATVTACTADKTWRDYFILKTPNELLGVATTTAELQAAVVPALKQADSAAAMAETSKGLSGTLGSKVEVKGEVLGYGQDDRCVYLGGVLDLNAPDRGIAYTLAMAGCMTVVGGRVVTIYRYAPGTSAADVRALLPSVRNFAGSIRVKAAGGK